MNPAKIRARAVFGAEAGGSKSLRLEPRYDAADLRRATERSCWRVVAGLGGRENRGALVTENLNALLAAIRRRYDDLGPQAHRRESFLAHVRSLAHWEADPHDYPDPGPVSFPEEVSVAYAVCHPRCGRREFIIDGSTQECQDCGSLMYRTEVATYQLSKCGAE